jgi:lipopolysaccharide biosynthesis glycosyltransferase
MAAREMVFHVSCAVERNYAAHSAAMLHSALVHLPTDRVRIHYLHGPGFPAGPREQLAEMIRSLGASISFVEVPDAMCDGLPTKGFTRRATWYKIFLPDLLSDVDSVLHLDADLVATDSLVPLWDVNIEDNYLAAVTNVFEEHLLEWPTSLGLEGRDHYFNAGVLMLNLSLMRTDGCSRAMWEYGVAHAEELKYREQDVLNAVLARRRVRLHPRWNVMNSLLLFPWGDEVLGSEAREEAQRNPAIRHFEGPSLNKPWHYLCERGMREVYLEHRRHTPWPRVRLEGATPANFIRRRLRDRRGGGRRLAAGEG